MGIISTATPPRILQAGPTPRLWKKAEREFLVSIKWSKAGLAHTCTKKRECCAEHRSEEVISC